MRIRAGLTPQALDSVAAAKRGGIAAKAKAIFTETAPIIKGISPDAAPNRLRAASSDLHDILAGLSPARTDNASLAPNSRVPGSPSNGKTVARRELRRGGTNAQAVSETNVPAPEAPQTSEEALDKEAAKPIQHRLWFKIMAGLVMGIGVGLLLGPDLSLLSPGTTAIAVKALAFPGKIFLSLIGMVAVPLVFSSITQAIGGSKNFQQLKALGLRAAIYFTTTTVVATIIGVAVATLIQPGTFFPAASVATATAITPAAQGTLPGLVDTILGLIPSNPVAAFVSGNMLQLVFFAIVMGVALASMKPWQSKPLLDLMDSTQRVCMTVVKWAMKLAPYAVFGLIAKVCAEVGASALLGMGIYMGTVVLGLAGVLAFYCLLVSVIGKKNPFRFLSAVRDPLLLAFSTSSSAAAMPVSIKTAKEKLGVRPFIADLLVPVGATINMDGTALYQVVATIFLAQVYGIQLSLGALALLIATTVGASIGTPGTPGVGMVILSMVLGTVGIPMEGIALLLGVDRILDMTRSAVNVSGDLTATVVMDKLLGRKAEQLDKPAKTE